MGSWRPVRWSLRTQSVDTGPATEPSLPLGTFLVLLWAGPRVLVGSVRSFNLDGFVLPGCCSHRLQGRGVRGG